MSFLLKNKKSLLLNMHAGYKVVLGLGLNFEFDIKHGSGYKYSQTRPKSDPMATLVASLIFRPIIIQRYHFFLSDQTAYTTYQTVEISQLLCYGGHAAIPQSTGQVWEQFDPWKDLKIWRGNKDS